MRTGCDLRIAARSRYTYSSRLLTWANVASSTSHGVAARGPGRSWSHVLSTAGMSAQSAMSSANDSGSGVVTWSNLGRKARPGQSYQPVVSKQSPSGARFVLPTNVDGRCSPHQTTSRQGKFSCQ